MSKKLKDDEKDVVSSAENKDKTTTLDAQVAELVGDLQRTRADFENFRKQVDLQKENERKAACLATVYKILPFLDRPGNIIE